MARMRIAIPDFQDFNPVYAAAKVTFWTVDAKGAKTMTKATLYDTRTGTGTLANPMTLDSVGKLRPIPYIEEGVIASVTGSPFPDHDTGITSPPLDQSKTRREQRKQETLEKYQRWFDLAQKIKGGNARKPVELARAVSKELSYREKAETIRRRMDEYYPGWADQTSNQPKKLRQKIRPEIFCPPN